MAKRGRPKKSEGEQQELLDVGPEHSEEMVELAKKYKKALDARMAAQQKEVEAKERLLALIKDEHLTPLEDGKIRFKI